MPMLGGPGWEQQSCARIGRSCDNDTPGPQRRLRSAYKGQPQRRRPPFGALGTHCPGWDGLIRWGSSVSDYQDAGPLEGNILHGSQCGHRYYCTPVMCLTAGCTSLVRGQSSKVSRVRNCLEGRRGSTNSAAAAGVLQTCRELRQFEPRQRML